MKVRTLEKLRLSAWKKSQSEGERDKDKRGSPRMFENSSVPATTKGVKFAVSVIAKIVFHSMKYLLNTNRHVEMTTPIRLTQTFLGTVVTDSDLTALSLHYRIMHHGFITVRELSK